MVNGRIRAEDVTYVIDHSNIADVIGDYVQLKNAGGGQAKGLCPFHDEKSPSFHVTPSKGFYHCFGCQAGGNVVTFLTQLEHLTFVEAIEKLASRLGYQLHYEQGSFQKEDSISRSRIFEANKLAMLFYQAELEGAGRAQEARDFLKGRGFERAAALDFQIGYAPDNWDELRKALLAKGFNDEELLVAGLTTKGSKGPIDRFRHRVIWPIKDPSGEVVGFGARKLGSDQEDQGPKYLNTPETPVYKKSQILYGLDKAKKEISKQRRVVVVEGYTDVMAAHLAGVTTAVATCGTAFGDGHIGIIRRYLLDEDTFRGEIIFTFDGDAAGQKAALKAFGDDQKFVAQTFVAVARNGMDPCELRINEGDIAVRNLVESRIPLFEFAIRQEISQFNLSTPEGRVSALSKVAPLVGKIKDRSLRPEYIRLLALWIGVDPDLVQKNVNDSYRKQTNTPAEVAPAGQKNIPTGPTDALSQAGRELLKLALQHPDLVENIAALGATAFPYPPYLAIKLAVEQNPNPTSMLEVLPAEIKPIARELLVEPITSEADTLPIYAGTIFARVEELALAGEVESVKSELSRLNPEESPEAYNATFARLMEIESRRRQALQKIRGE